jgi:hypothetical protein
VHATIILNICKYQVGTAMGLGFVKQFTVKSHFNFIDKATSSNMFLLNSLHLLISVNVNSYAIKKFTITYH